MLIKLGGTMALTALGLLTFLCVSGPVCNEAGACSATAGNRTIGGNLQGKELPPLDYDQIVQFTVTGVDVHEWTREPGKSSKTRKVDISLRLDGIIKGQVNLDVGKAANVVVTQLREPGGLISEASGFWSRRTLQKDCSYVLFSNGRGGDLGSVFEGGKELADLSGDTTTLSDLRHIVKIGKLNPADQASEICEYMAKSGPAHGKYLAQYIAALAVLPSMPSDTKLFGLISNPRDLKLSEKGMHTLIGLLQMKVDEDGGENEKLTGTVAMAICRYIASIDPSEALPPMKADALQNWLPWLVNFEPARKRLQEFRKNEKECLDAVASFEKIGASKDVNDENRGHLKAVVKILTSGK